MAVLQIANWPACFPFRGQQPGTQWYCQLKLECCCQVAVCVQFESSCKVSMQAAYIHCRFLADTCSTLVADHAPGKLGIGALVAVKVALSGRPTSVSIATCRQSGCSVSNMSVVCGPPLLATPSLARTCFRMQEYLNLILEYTCVCSACDLLCTSASD